MKLYLKSPVYFFLQLLKWSLIFALVTAIYRLTNIEFQGVIVLFAECIRVVFVSFPLIYSLAFIEVLIFLMSKNNTSYLPIITLIIPFLLIIFVLQPLFYVQSLNIIGCGDSFTQIKSASFTLFTEPAYSVNIFFKELYVMLDEGRQVYFESYARYLFAMLTYVFFLFSLSLITINAKWKMFNVILILFLFRFFTYLYGIMNINENEIFIFGFSTNELKGIPTNIVNIGYACILYAYGILSRLKVF
ncbi:MAG: hypothetical protein ACTTIZ_05765 [Treponema sp.]